MSSKATAAQQRTIGRGWYEGLTLPRVWALVVLGLIFLMLTQATIGPNDFWWHVRAGQVILETGQVPNVDLFSFTRLGEPWAYQSWLMEIALYLQLGLGGLSSVIFSHAVILTTGYLFLLLASRVAAGGVLHWAAIATLAAALGSPNWQIRPQSITIFFFALTLFLLERHSTRLRSGLSKDRTLWVLPVLFVLWANAHGGFVFGLLLLGAAVLGEGICWLQQRSPFPKQLLFVAGLCTAGTLLTPLGPGMIDYVLGFVRHPITQNYNAEFQPGTIRTLDGQLFFGYAIVWIAVVIAGRYRPTARQVLPLLLFAFLALWSRRNMIWFCFVSAPILAAALAYWSTARRPRDRPQAPRRPWLNWAVLTLMAGLFLLGLPWLRPYLSIGSHRGSFLATSTPEAAVAHLCQMPRAERVFHSEGDGSYLIWACPEKPVFIDTRFELYPEDQWLDWAALSAGRHDWQKILDRYQIDTLLLEKERMAPLIDAAGASSNWEQVYEDEQRVIMVRNE